MKGEVVAPCLKWVMSEVIANVFIVQVVLIGLCNSATRGFNPCAF
jgi:hypothetical protein